MRTVLVKNRKRIVSNMLSLSEKIIVWGAAVSFFFPIVFFNIY